MKTKICSMIGLTGSTIACLFGGWDSSLITLLIFMGVDYLSGLIVAGVYKKSPKSEGGTLKSSVCFEGICKKCMILLLVLISNRLDVQIGTTYVRDAVCIAFTSNELISIIENAGVMGIPVPKLLKNAIEILRNKEDDK